MHPLLKRQLKRLGLDDVSAPHSPEIWQQLLERVSRSYLESDQGRELLERSIALSATEMQALNEQLRRTSESRLTEERDKLQTVLRSMGDGLCVVDANWDIVLLNPEAERLCGLSEHEVVGRRLDLISSPTARITETLFTQMLLDETTQGHSFRTDDGFLTSITADRFPSPASSPLLRETTMQSVPSWSFAISPNANRLKIVVEKPNIYCDNIRPSSLVDEQQRHPERCTRASCKEITQVAAATLKVRRCGIWLLREDHCPAPQRSLRCSPPTVILRAWNSRRTVSKIFRRIPDTERVIDATDARTDPRTSEFTRRLPNPAGYRRHGIFICSAKLVGVLCNEYAGPPRAWMPEEQQFSHAIACKSLLALEAVERLHAEGALA